MRRCFAVLLILVCWSVQAQDHIPVPITSDNITQLSSANQIDFEVDITRRTDPNIPYTGQVKLGWFVQSNELDDILLIDADNYVLNVGSVGEVKRIYYVKNLIDAAPFADNYFALLYPSDIGFDVWYVNADDNHQSYNVSVKADISPSAIWTSCDNENPLICIASVEAFTSDGDTIIINLPEFDTSNLEVRRVQVTLDDLDQYPYLPALDEEAVVRIGRIPLPYIVTSSLDGMVQLWNLQDDELVHEVDNGTGQPSVFGNINADATHLVWRDNANETLYLLNFETGENREIAPLNGQYAQWYFLSNDASVTIAVNLGGEPNIVAWDVATGEQTDLGNYRDCNRPQPDMVRMTPDGSTLVIGCDTGLDIWQIVEE